MNPVRKDTFVVPNKGYIILRFYTDNLGKNLLCLIDMENKDENLYIYHIIYLPYIYHSESDFTVHVYQDIGSGKREVPLYILHYSGLECNS